MVWFLGIWAGGPLFEWEDKSGLYGHKETPLPFGKWTPSKKITDTINIPKYAKQSGSELISDAFWIGDAGVVSARFKNIVEEYEPDRHQFFPIVLKKESGEPYSEDYYIFHPTSYVPCVLLSECKRVGRLTVRHGPNSGMPGYTVDMAGFAVSETAIGDRKIFGSIFVPNKGLFVANEIMERIQALKMTNFIEFPVKVVQKNWSLRDEAPDIYNFMKENPNLKTYMTESF
jgi:hypothetical protein